MAEDNGKKAEPRKIFNIPIFSIVIVLFIVGSTAIILHFIFQDRSPFGPDYVIIGDRMVRFRSQIDECLKVPISSGVAEDLTSPYIERIVLLMDPYGSAAYGLSVYEVSRFTSHVAPTTIAYTRPKANDTTAVLSLYDGLPQFPIVLVVENSTYTGIERVSPGQIRLGGTNQTEVDAAACRLGLAIFEKKYGLEVQ